MRNKNLIATKTLLLRNNKLILILILGLILRLISLNQSLWLDEATSVNVAQMSIVDIITKFSPGDFHPPLYYLFLKGWGSVFGWSESGVRTFSVIAGLGTIWFVYKIAEKLFDKKIAFWSALFLATSPLHIYYSQEARMYSLETFFAVGVIYFFLQVVKLPDEKNNWTGMVISSLLLLYTDYLPAFLLLSLVFYILIFHKDHFKKYKKKWLESFGIIAIVFMIWLPILWHQFCVGTVAQANAPLWIQTLGKTSLKGLVLVPVKFIIGRISLADKVLYRGVVIPLLAVFGLVLIRARNRLLWFVLLGSVVLSALFGFVFSGFYYFRLLFVLPSFYLLLAEGVFALNKNIALRLAGAIIAVNIICSLVYLLLPQFHREDWKGAVSWIEQYSQGQKVAAVFVTNSQKDPYIYYAKITKAYGPQDISDNSYDKVYLMRYVQPIFDPRDTVRKKIELLGYKKAQEKDFNGIVVWEYVR